MDRPLSERLDARAAFEDKRVLDEARAMGFVPEVYTGSQTGALLREAAEFARRVEEAPCVPVIDGGMMIRPFFQYGRFDLPDDGENPATKEARLLGQFVGQRVRIVPEDGLGVGNG